MCKNLLLIFIILISICFGISMGVVCANDNTTLNDNLTTVNHSDSVNNDNSDEMLFINQNGSELSNKISSSQINDNATVDYLIKSKEKLDSIAKKTTVKDRTFKLGKYKLVISKKDYKQFLYVQFADKYLKTGKDVTLLMDIFKLNYHVMGLHSCLQMVELAYHSVSKKTNSIINQKIGLGYKDSKTKKIYFKNHKKAKNFVKQSRYIHKIKFDKKLKKYYVKADMPVYKKIITRKASVYIRLEYSYKRFELFTYTKYDYKWDHLSRNGIIRDYTIYKSSKNLKNLNKSKTKKSYEY